MVCSDSKVDNFADFLTIIIIIIIAVIIILLILEFFPSALADVFSLES